MKGWKFWLGVVISLTALGLFAKDLEWTAFVQAWKRIQWGWYSAGIVLFCVSFWLRCPRWRILVNEVGSVSLSLLTKAFFIGMLVNRIMPARLGEVARCVVLKKKAGLPLAGLFATVGVEKALDGLALLSLICVGAFVLTTGTIPGDLQAIIEEHRAKFLTVAIGLPIGLAIFAWSSPLLLRCVGWAESKSESALVRQVGKVIASFAGGLSILRKGKSVLSALGMTAVVWSVLIVSEYCTLRSFGWDLPLAAPVILCVSIGIAVSVPQAPGYVGVYHLAVQWALEGFYGIETQEAIAFAVAIWITQIIPLGLIGLVCLRLLGTRLGETLQERDTRSDQA